MVKQDRWTLRNDVIWNKPNAMPESVTDRLSNRYEHVFLFSKSRRYWFDLDPIREAYSPNQRPGKTPRQFDYAPGDRNDSAAMGWGNFDRDWERGRNPGDVWTIPTTPFTGSIVRTARPDRDHHDPDAPAYGMERIPSPDCPVHGSGDRPDSSLLRGAREDVSVSRSAGTGASPVPAPAADSVPTFPHHEQSTPVESSDSPRREDAPAAMPHSSGNRRTDPALSTSQPYMPSAQTRPRTADNESQLAFDVPGNRTAASSTDEHGSHVSPAQTRPRTADRCTCSWTKTSVTTSHFAVMPVALASRCIQAGCKPGGTVLDPFSGTGTTGLAAARHGRRYIGIDLSTGYLNDSLRTRLGQMALLDGEAL